MKLTPILALLLVGCGGAGSLPAPAIQFEGAAPQSLPVGKLVHVTANVPGVRYWVEQTEGPAECISVTTNGHGTEYGPDCYIKSTAKAAGVLKAEHEGKLIAEVDVRWVK